MESTADRCHPTSADRESQSKTTMIRAALLERFEQGLRFPWRQPTAFILDFEPDVRVRCYRPQSHVAMRVRVLVCVLHEVRDDRREDLPIRLDDCGRVICFDR